MNDGGPTVHRRIYDGWKFLAFSVNPVKFGQKDQSVKVRSYILSDAQIIITY
ncbi:hypothetical protein [Desertivirga brevis]|uniref:hypothetical protein n=1 Tax=Desertivirga brevis TaxID=2810310 RepID=UPI001A96D402|nr:hypothetical protein [Pedobacter sp. SYSU D00873]